MTRRPRGILLALFLIASGLRVAAVLVSAPVDDAFITYRYARNLAAGHGFVYNLGERVLGTTTPFFTLLLTPFAGFGIPLEKVAAVLAVVASLGTMGLLFSFVRRAARRAVVGREDVAESAGLLAAALYALFYAQIASCGYGMETQVF
jgi:arabinofuranosyltransferase